MANSIGPTGLTLATFTEILTGLKAAMQTIYGSDINLDSDSPDGQMLGTFSQAVVDVEDLLAQIYSGLDPDTAIGVVLDMRVAINGIQRQAGTKTVTNITLVTTQALTLYGLDQTVQPVYTVSDNAGNQWQLQNTQTPSGAGTYVYVFQASVAGAVLTVPNSITIPVTIVLGVTSVNNPTTFTSLGLNEETDAALRIRRQKSVTLASQGFLSGLLAALENITGMSSVFVYENDGSSVNGDGVPGHTIWVIVSGTAAPADIANAIYTKRAAGCGMFGDQSYTITQKDGSAFIVNWDVVTSEDIYVKFTVTSLNGIDDPKINQIKTELVTSYVPGVDQEVDVNGLGTAVQKIDPNTLVTLAGFSTTSGGSYTTTLTPATKAKQFLLAAAKIIIYPMILYPKVSNVVHTTGTVHFTTSGGYSTLTYSISANNSGGSIGSSSGIYTAGSTPSTDTILVTDANSQTATATVVVT